MATKNLKCPGSEKGGKDSDKTSIDTKVLVMEEKSWRLRRGSKKRGRARLTQGAYICANRLTMRKLRNNTFATHAGSVKSDVVGPITLDPIESIPKIEKRDVVTYYGARRVLAGGPCNDSDDDNDKSDEDEDEEDDHTEESDKRPINYHCLPTSLIIDFVKAYDCKHVIDFSPSPMHLGIELMKIGVTYFALCGTEFQRETLNNQLLDDIK